MALTSERAYFRIENERMRVLNKENSSTNLTIKITKYLLSKSVVHYVDLMEYTGLSRKTVSKYLDRVEKMLEKKSVTLNRKRGSGIYLTGNLDHLRGVLPSCSDNAEDDDPRRIALLSFLLNSEKPILLDDLAEHFYISRSTLERDLNYLKEYFGVKLSKSNQGIISRNNELEIRQILSQLIQEHWNQRLIENTETGKMVQNFQIPDYLSEYIDPQLISRVQKVLVKFWQEYKIQANEYQYEPLLIHISISMKRITEKKYITEADILDLPISSETHYLIDLLEKEFEFNIPLTEAKYFEMYVAVFNDNFDSFGSLQVVSELTMWLKRTLPSYDDELLRNLAVHLVPALKRGKMGFSVKNPYAQEIKEKFPTAFDQALDLTLMIQKHFKIVLPENEIAYTALHLELFNKRHPHQDKDVSIMIVCSSGYGTSQLLRQRVLESIKDVNVIGTMSVTDFIEKAPKADVVLSTVPLKMDRSRVIQVSPFLNETEVELVKKVCNEVRKKEYIHASFMELLRPE